MKAVVFEGHQKMQYSNVPDAELEQPTDVLLRVQRTAICGSDLHLWHQREPQAVGFTVGHEFLGVIEDTGPEVQRFKKGDRVFVACTIGCGGCPSCRRGVMSGCPVTTAGGTQTNVFGFGGFGGGQAEAVRVPFADTNCFPLPSHLSDDQCLFLTDILPTGFLGTEIAEIGPGDRVVVFGCGPVGTFAQRCAQLRGAACVIAVDLDAHRLELAAKRGSLTINAATENVEERVLELTDGLGADSSIEAVGVPELINQAARVTRPGGRVAVIGVVMAPWQIEWPSFFGKNLHLGTGLVSPQTSIHQLLPLIEQGRLDPSEIISHRYPLAEASEAYDLFASRRDQVLKVVLEP